MTRRNLFLILPVIMLLTLVAIPSAHAIGFTVGTRNFAVSVDNFHSALTPYGSWVTVPTYGEVFRPTVVTGWTPYATTSPWGNVTYNYGQWINAPGYGYVWIPSVGY